MAMIM